MSAQANVTIKLEFVDDNIKPPVTKLEMRRPKVRDQITASKAAKDPATQECTLFAALCEVPIETIENLDMSDYTKIQEAYEVMTRGKS